MNRAWRRSITEELNGHGRWAIFEACALGKMPKVKGLLAKNRRLGDLIAGAVIIGLAPPIQVSEFVKQIPCDPRIAWSEGRFALGDGLPRAKRREAPPAFVIEVG